MSTLGRSILLMAVALLVCPGLGLAQEPLGVVTTLSGQATRTASATPDAPAPLRFKDGVFGADTIRTAEHAFVRMLLERKAVLTVRELSVLRIAEDATQATVDLRSGGIAFSVARPRLRPGEAVLIHTPNAVAAVRGTSIVVETQGAVSHFHVLTGTLDVAARANPTAWQRLQAPASLTVTGAVVGAARGLDAGTRGRLTADYLGLRVAEPGAPAEVVAQEQAKAVLLARLIGGDGAGGDGDPLEMLAVPEVPVAQAAPGMQSPAQAPVAPPVTPSAPAATPVTPPPPPLQSWNSQTATVTGDLYNMPGATTGSLGSGIASATGSAVTVTNEVVDVTGTLTATATTPAVALQSSTLAARTLASVQVGSLSLTGGPLLDAAGGGVSTTDDLVRVMSGGGLAGPAAGPLLSLSGTSLNVGNGSGDRLLELAGAGSRVNLGGALLDASASTVTLTGTSLVEVSTGAALTAAGASPLVGLTGGALVLNSAATGFLWSSAAGSTLGGGLLHTSGTHINAAIASPGDLLRVTGPLSSPSTSPLFSLAGGNVRARNLGVVSSGAGILTLGGAFLDRSGTGNTLATTDDLLNVSAGGRLVAGGTAPLLRFTDTTVNVGNGSGDQLFQLTGAGSAASLAGGLLEASSTAFTLTGSALVDVSAGAVLTATGSGPVAALSGGSVSLGGAAGFLVSSTGASQIAGSLLRTANTSVTTTSNLVGVSGSLTGTGSTPLLDLTGGAVSARNGVLVSSANGRLALNGPALDRAGGTLTTTDDLFNVSGGGRLTSTGTGALLGFANATVNVGNASGDQLFVVTGTGSAATLAGPVLDASNTALTLTGSAFVEVSSGATLTAPSAAPLTALSGGALSLGGAAGFLVSSTGPSTMGGSLLRTTGTGVTTTGNLVTVSGSLTNTGTDALLDLTGGTVSARNGVAVSSANGRLGLNGSALRRTGGSLAVTDDLVSITAGGRLTDTGTGPLLILANATLSVGNGSGDQLFVVNGTGSRATLAGPLLSAAGSALSVTGAALVEVSSSATLTGTSTQRLVSLSGGTLTLGSAASAFLLNTSGTATLAGGLLDTTGTDITAAGDFVRALGGGRVVVTGSTAPLLSLTGGTHQFGATGNIYRLSGTATAVDPLSGLTLGTQQPIQAAGSLFEAVGATATTQRAVRLDVALLQASAPLLSLRANGAVASGLTTSSNAIDLTSRAKLNATAPVIALDGSRLTVTNASVVNVAGGSYLGVTGNLLSVANGSQLSVTNGTLLFAAGGSVVNISGALLSFGGAGSTVTVSNALCPCTLIGGIPVRLSGGALAANVSITNPIQNAAGNTVSITAGAAAIRVDGATTRVTVSGQ
ncbi:MAG TPA: FecR domain-containing protein [Candidatus Deferrimicrobiaceae bacterium]|nr:FecR domain-containing protein [Candidatus Deferrimicrobiaceae bacterium]